jgi:hypothetical protein
VLLQHASPEQWQEVIQQQNRLQKRTPASAKRVSQALRKRLERLDAPFWQAIRDGDDLLGHVLYALKHEGISLDILAQCLPLIAKSHIRAAIDASPTSQYLRKAGYLWATNHARWIMQTNRLYVPLRAISEV